jgi:hypothetical protein
MNIRLFLALLTGLALTQLPPQAAVVINEIFYHAPDDVEDLEFVEIHNTSDATVDLSGWKFSKGMRHTFAPGTKIAPRGFLVLCRNQARFNDAYGFEAHGTFDQPLSNNGERLELIDASGARVDTVKYSDGPPWPAGPDGHSASLERISPAAAGELLENWAGSPLTSDMKPGGTPGKVNANYSANLPPSITNVKFSPTNPQPDQPIDIQAEVRDSDGVSEVKLLYRTVGPGKENEEIAVSMEKETGQRFIGRIPGQSEHQILRFRVVATDAKGVKRFYPSEHDPRPALSLFVHRPFEAARIPFGFVINVGESEFKTVEQHRKQSGPTGSNEEMRQQFMVRMMIQRSIDLASAWCELAVKQNLSMEQVQRLQAIFTNQIANRDKLIEQTLASPDLNQKMSEIPKLIGTFQQQLLEAAAPVLKEEQKTRFAEWQQKNNPQAGSPQWGPDMMLKQFIAAEEGFFNATTRLKLTEAQFNDLKALLQTAIGKREGLAESAKAVMQGQGEWEDLQGKIEAVNQDLEARLKKILSAEQQKEFARLQQANNPFMMRRGGNASSSETPVQGRSAFVWVDPQSRQAQIFDFVNVATRNAGYKIHFHKDQALRGQTTINLIFEYNDRFLLAEPLAYELYRRVGNAAPQTDFVRLWIDGNLVGYHLLVEQPNRAFLRRNKLKEGGNLYKILWYERGVVGQHEKKTNRHLGHDDIVALIEQLESTKGDEQWALIQKHFNVPQVVNYFAVNSCLSHWDGFFNNYFTYHDTERTKKWEMYPWDQDKTWGFHDGLRDNDVFYDLPLTFGMEGDVPPGWPEGRPPPRGFGGNSIWWRPGGYFSKPLLANPQFRKLYLARIKEIVEKIYTEEIFFPIITATGERLKEEVTVRATAMKQDPESAVRRLERNLQSLRDHLVKRRKFLLEQAELKEVASAN